MTDDEIVALVGGESRETRRHLDEVAASVLAALRTIADGHRILLERLQQEQDARAADSLDVRADLRGVTRELLRLKRESRTDLASLRAEILSTCERLHGRLVDPPPGPP